MTKQEKYSMNIADIAKEIRKKLKKEFPSCTFSVTIERYSMGQSMDICLVSAPFEAIIVQRKDEKNYMQVNDKWLYNKYAEYQEHNGHMSYRAWQVIKKAVEIANHYNFDESDPQTDYFDVNFYLDVTIGKWDKPFQKKGDFEVKIESKGVDSVLNKILNYKEV